MPRLLRSMLPRLLGIWLASLFLMPAAHAWWSQEWSYRKQITIDTGPAGGDALKQVPVLVRLHDGVIRFSDLAPDGSDLRFVAEDDKTPLKHHVEKFDNVFNLAFVWVSLPQVEPGKPVKVWLYYGNAKGAAGEDTRGSYDAQQTLVWHFGERGKPVADSTSYANAAAGPVAIDEAGYIGSAAKFDGSSTATLPGSPSLAWAAGGGWTWSAWIKPAAAGQTSVIYARRDGARALRIGLANGAPTLALSDEQGREERAVAGAPLSADGWHHLAVLAGSKLQLLVDGQPVATLAQPLPAMNTAAVLGGDAPAAGATALPGYAGGLDELQLSNVERPLALLRLAVANQGPESKTLAWGGDEQLSTWESGYVAIILRSVTLDGWIVIGLLVVMAVVSWGVMIGKARALSQVTRANAAFLHWYRKTGADWVAHVQGDASAPAPAAQGSERHALDSPLYRLYTAGLDELKRRVRGPAGSSAGLSPQAIEAIRAQLDAEVVETTQRLNARMVLLTIAISGGPFLGLLGTVVGVMITFAAIAAAGDVNVNAIAPGISAALVATVAGLLVAIPALFGYNYLLTRIKDATADLRVFLDAFIARIAERHTPTSPAPGPVLHGG